ncbi:MAG: PAS domain-containing sensor histidine kinase [Anaerolineae bacterium]|nr:PAS domain-containing sensor histidine kinase [Anaerolineae bacterium]MDW8173448.1 PAS domain-containing sensor histidine kinase [Anaerolineae bacterium]
MKSHLEKTNAQLRRQEARLRSLLESQTAYLVRTDMEGRFTYVNRPFARRFSSGRDLIGSDSLETVAAEDRDLALNVVVQCVAQPGQPVPVTLRKPDGQGGYFYTDWEFVAVLDEDGQVAEIQCVGFDATARMKAQEALIEHERVKAALREEQSLNQLKTQMIRRISHEFRTPLAIIQMNIENLYRYYERLDESQRTAKLHKTRREIDHLSRMLEDMSRLLRGQQQALEFLPAPTRIVALCRDIVEQMHALMDGAERINLHSDVAEDDTHLLDEDIVRTILTNLLSNALKYSPSNKRVALYLSACGDELELRVVDQGIGISLEDQARIFEPFFRTQQAESISGMGLGLSIVADAVRAHQGRISVESAPERGTTFTVCLPGPRA